MKLSHDRLPRTLVAGVALLIAIVLAVLIIPLVSPYDPTAEDISSMLQPPSFVHPFGTDQLGRDLLVRVAAAGRVDLALMVGVELMPFIIGTAAGLIAGYYGGWPNRVITLLSDALIAFPFYLLVAVVAFVTGTGITGIFLTFLIMGWIIFARTVKGATASLAVAEWVESARVMGFSDASILVHQMLPNVLSQAVIVLVSDMVALLVAIVTLGYLGLGVTPPTPDWGTMIADGQSFLSTRWWVSTLPGCAVVLVGIALALIGDGLNDARRQA
ncbi:ABC transporter permease [Bifidobacterium imperatoris]|uniref:ABC transporter permease n=1 Tax=Bifidobacterium imperatoris TaxID=2020965 RepID=A0A2N5IR96_9BIFI|nr:ABC transporter permease [Bifidobacterium imperatoris]PLS24481.1 nickel ABC transporter permease [Bifidobacterium imperatoris]QSY58099.1 ABC transporter permease [Bifidobacterium imperatoris]